MFCAACSCPATPGSPDTKADWTAQRDAACAVVEGCDPEYLAQVPVHEVSVETTLDVCEGWGCFCVQPGCAGVILYTDMSSKGHPPWSIVLHEYLHAAFYSVDVDTEKHPRVFIDALSDAVARLQ
jgi:hypothetical protein